MLKLRRGGGIAEAIPYTNHNGELKVPISGWTNYGGELKQIWPPETFDIYDQTALEIFRDLVNAGNTSLNGTVTTDITLTGEWTPIGVSYNQGYTGTFDGGGYTITGLTITSGSYLGLFGKIDTGGTVKNVKLINTSVSGQLYIGSVVGYNGGGTIENCSNNGTVTSTFQSTSGYVGGIVGYTSSGIVENCTNSGSVNGVYCVGGIAGSTAAYVTVSGCINESTVIATGDSSTSGLVVGYAGGISGRNHISTIENCTNSGSVSGCRYAGGITGTNSAYFSTKGTVSGNTNTGAITGDTSWAVN